MRIVQRPELEVARRLLRDAGLPQTDLSDDSMDDFIGLRDADRWTGLVGVERYRDVALLRSLVIADAYRGSGHGKRLLRAAEDHARDQAVRTMYLLTETAEPFFAAAGYAATERDSAPESIRSTREFSELCPASAVLMSKPLGT